MLLVPFTQLSHKQSPVSCLWGFPLQEPTLWNMHWDFCRSAGVVTLPKAERGVGVASLLTTAHKPSPAAGVRSVHSASPWSCPSPRPWGETLVALVHAVARLSWTS